jgi:hypothetical protein
MTVESPLYLPCPTCGASPFERCTNLVTGMAQFEYHPTRVE